MLLYGAGGHAKVILAAIHACEDSVYGIFDDAPKAGFSSVPVLGRYNSSFMPGELLIISIGENEIRKRVSMAVIHPFGTIIHPSSVVDQNAHIGLGTAVLHRSVIQTGVIIGRHVIINTGAIIEHDSHIADFAHVAPGAVICGNVTVGERTLIGVGSIVVPNTMIGSNCLIAAGSVVTTHIPDNVIARGNPARIINKKQ